MQYVELGRTGLKVSVAGLGTGGHSRLGQQQGASIEHSVGVVHAAIDMGVNVIDVSETGGIEPIVGRAIKDRRSGLTITTKLHPTHKDKSWVRPDELRAYVEGALERLSTDVVDIFYLHSIKPGEYDYCEAELVPEMRRLCERGLIRFTGVSEYWARKPDTEHQMLARAVQGDCWDVVMTGLNILNQSATRNVLPGAIERGIGVFVMYAVRDLLSRPELLRATVKDAIDKGLMDASGVDADDPLGFLLHEGGATSVIDAAYRFARHTPGVHTVLTGTGNIEHLRANVESINRGPLPAADHARLASLFGHFTHLTGNSDAYYKNKDGDKDGAKA